MTETPSEHRPAASAEERPKPGLKRAEHAFETVLFNSRWLMAPFYLGLVISLAVLLYKFVELVIEFIVHAPLAKNRTSSSGCCR